MKNLRTSDLYEPSSVRTLFDEMAKTYGLTNTLSSLGFSQRWRKQCVSAIAIPEKGRLLDLMTGAGELLHTLYRGHHNGVALSAVDFSNEMVKRARSNSSSWGGMDIEVMEADVLEYDFPPNHYDAVVSSFGLKTFSSKQLSDLARVISGTLKPGGVFSLLEISVPRSPLIRTPFMFYLKYVIPLIGTICLGNPDNYRYLGVYTERFGSCESIRPIFESAGLDLRVESFFFGCATGLVGKKPHLRSG